MSVYDIIGIAIAGGAIFIAIRLFIDWIMKDDG